MLKFMLCSIQIKKSLSNTPTVLSGDLAER